MATRISPAVNQHLLIQQSQVEWGSLDNFILLNPFLNQEDKSILSQLAIDSSANLKLQSHVWLATSGSTSETQRQVKLVALSQRALVQSAISVNQWIQVNQHDRWLQVLPFFHVGGLGIELRAKISETPIYYSQMSKWQPEIFIQECNENQITITSLVPTQVFDLVKLQLTSPKNMRAIFVGGGQLSIDLYIKARQLGWPILPSYGMTETGSMIACASLDSLAHLDVLPKLKILPHAQVKTNQDDYLVIEGASLLTVYAQNIDEKGINTRVYDPKMNGQFITEDYGQIVNHCLEVKGRKTDFIKIGGEATNLLRLREIFKQIAQTDDIVLHNQADQRLGQKIIIVAKHEFENQIQEVVEKFNSQVLPYEKIREIFLIEEIPKSAIGKIQYEKINKMIEEKK